MWKDAGPGFRVHCDHGAKVLRVATNIVSSVPFLKPQWRETAAFRTHKEWGESRFAKQITDESVEEMILWFWLDIAPEPT